MLGNIHLEAGTDPQLTIHELAINLDKYISQGWSTVKSRQATTHICDMNGVILFNRIGKLFYESKLLITLTYSPRNYLLQKSNCELSYILCRFFLHKNT